MFGRESLCASDMELRVNCVNIKENLQDTVII